MPAAPLATQLKYRARAQEKLPRWAEAGCMYEAQAFEQCTSEQIAAIKPWGQGQSALDLTCGLGVDAAAMAPHYAYVTTIEADRIRFMMARHNFQLLGLDNISVWHSEAEEWVRDCHDSQYDLIYLDPDRRDAQGGRHYRFADCSPNVLNIQALLLKMAPRVLIKASPMLDIDAGLRELTQVHQVTVVALDGECKELLFELRANTPTDHEPQIGVRFVRKGRLHTWEGACTRWVHTPQAQPHPQYLYEADIALYKARRAAEWFADQYPSLGTMNHPDGYCFAETPIADFPGRAFEVLQVWLWRPETVKKHLKAAGISQVNLSRRHFDIPIEQVRTQLHIQEGGLDYLLLTQMWNEGEWNRVAMLARRI
jgi:hypothetical protein